MSDDEIRVAIAEKCGWRQVKTYGWPSDHRLPKTYIHNDELPDYPNDLNACHEAWGTLDRKQRISFSQNLRIVVVNAGGHAASFKEDIDACCENATASQRCEAFLRTFGLWKDNPTPERSESK